MTTKRKRASDAEVAEYWLTHDSAAEVDWNRGSGSSSTPTSNDRRDP